MATFGALQQALAGLAKKADGVTLVDILELPAPLDAALKKLLKEVLPLDSLANEIQLPVSETRQLMDILAEKGFVKTEEQPSRGGQVYKIYFARMRKRNLPAGLFDDA
jgi:predicted ArsR family transcriptional regulator